MKKTISTHKIVSVGLMTALVFVSNYIQFGIDTPIGPTRIHIANGICLLAALLFGGLTGGLAAGLGSFLFDLTTPAYVATSWVTFIMKFLLAFICGIILYARLKKEDKPVSLTRKLIATISGSLSYVVMYIIRQYIEQYLFLGIPIEVVTASTFTTKLPASLINAAIAVPIAILLHSALKPALVKSGLSDRMQIR